MASNTTELERSHTHHEGPTCYDEQADLDGKYAVEGSETCTHESCQHIEHELCMACETDPDMI